MAATNLPYPHGQGGGQIGEGANISTSSIPATTKGMFMAPAEEATTAAVNRGPYALSENIDHIWDKLHEDGSPKAQPHLEQFTAGVGGDTVTTLGAATDMFVGVAGATASDADKAFVVLDHNMNELVLGGSRITVSDAESGGVSHYAPVPAGGEFQSTVDVRFQDEDGVAATIPENTVYYILYGVKRGLEEYAMDHQTDVPYQMWHAKSAEDIQVLDSTVPNSCLYGRPVIVFPGTQKISYGDFWCIVRGKVHKITGSLTAAAGANDYVVLYVDEHGVVHYDTDAADYPAVDPELNLVLAYGQLVAGAWNTSFECGRNLTSKPAYMTIGASGENKSNFEDMSVAIDFYNYLYTQAGDETDLLTEGFEYPRLMVIGPTSMTSGVTLSAPIWIEGASPAPPVAYANQRQTMIDYDVAGCLFDCNGYQVVMKNLTFMYDGAGGIHRTDFIIKDAGSYSVFENVVTRQEGGPRTLDGAIKFKGPYSRVEHCLFFDAGTSGGSAALDASYAAPNNCDNLIIKDTIITAQCSNAQPLILDEVDNVLIDNCDFSGAATGAGIEITGTSTDTGKITIRNTDLEYITTAIVADGESLDLVLDSCKFDDGPINVGLTTPAYKVHISGCTFTETSDENIIKTDNLYIADTTSATWFDITLDDEGDTKIDGLRIDATDLEYGVKIDADGSGSGNSNIFVDNLSLSISLSGAVMQVTGLYLSESSSLPCGNITVSNSYIHLLNDSGSAVALVPLWVNRVETENLTIHNNRINFRALSGSGSKLNGGSGILYTHQDASSRDVSVNISDNSVRIDGDADTAGTWANRASVPKGIAVIAGSTDDFDGTITVHGNHIYGAAPSAGGLNHIGIYVERSDNVNVSNNKIYDVRSGIIIFPDGTAPVIMNSATIIGNRIDKFGDGGSADSNNWYNSAIGILCGFDDGADVYQYRTIVCHGNIVKSYGTADDAADHRYVLYLGTPAADGQISLHGNILRDEDDYDSTAGAGPDWHPWECAYSDFVPQDGGDAPLQANIFITACANSNSTP